MRKFLRDHSLSIVAGLIFLVVEGAWVVIGWREPDFWQQTLSNLQADSWSLFVVILLNTLFWEKGKKNK